MAELVEPAIIFLSYDEPNADENWQRLRQIAPKALRVHGVEGLHNAHLACVQASKQDMFFLIDGDNWVENIRFPDRVPLGKPFYAWRTRNAVNSLEYWNGGIKLLRKDAVASFQPNALDLMTSIRGLYSRRVLSENRFNSSPFL
jgi:hypothetical protein